MDTSRTATTIPQPPSLPLLKHLMWLDSDKPAQSILRLAERHGPIFRMSLPGRSFVVLSDYACVDEACDAARFSKALPAPLERLRALAKDGLFTAYNDEPNWALAHRILMPAFSLDAMRGYHDRMLDVGLQMVDRWARMRPDEVIDVPEHMTRLTLDVIALCGFDYRLNSFYSDALHPFICNMTNALDEAMRADNRPSWLNALMVRQRARFEGDVAAMHDLVDQLILERRARGDAPDDAQDLLGMMLNARDPVTGQSLDDENIRHQIVTFLIAGHETTSSLMSFALYYLMKNPDVYRRAVEEVDRVVGDPTSLPRFEQLRELEYLEKILFETMRLWPPAPGFVVSPNTTTTLSGHVVTPEDKLIVLLSGLHRDKTVWGPDPERFDPERFDAERVASRPANAWKPFGNGVRACIGRQFAMQEAKLVLALMLQRFSLHFADPDYTLEVSETLTFKPHHLRAQVRLREGRSVVDMLSRVTQAAPSKAQNPEGASPRIDHHGARLVIGYGSNMGTTHQLAERLAHDARRMGYAVELDTLDDLVQRPLDTGCVLAVLTASYNGHPPDNAARFSAWLDAQREGALEGVRYVVFGCGHRDWAATFQAVPERFDAQLEALGATRLAARGVGDSAGDLVAHFESWSARTWPRVHAAAGVSGLVEGATRDRRPALEVELVEAPAASSPRARPMVVEVNRELVDMRAPFARSKRHLELALPEGATYAAGDHLVVTPVNAAARVERFAQRLGWDLDQVVVLREGAGPVPATLPVDRPLSLRFLLSRHLELGQPLHRRQLQRLIEHTRCPPEQQRMRAWAEDEARYRAEVQDRALSLLDVLVENPSCAPPIGLALSLLAPMAPRTYSIASAPQAHPHRVHLTVSVLDAPAFNGNGRFEGTCSTFLAGLSEGDRVWAEIRTPQPPFTMPEDDTRAVVLISAGTGFAPLRGFIQQREAASASRDVGQTLVFSGCDREDVDLLYRDELEAWRSRGLIEVFVACSERPEGDVRFVQDRLWAERARVWEALEGGASIYVCGDGRHMAPAVRETLQRIFADANDASPEGVAAWWAACLGGEGAVRFFEDAWAG